MGKKQEVEAIQTEIAENDSKTFNATDKKNYKTYTNNIQKGFRLASKQFIDIGCNLYMIYHRELFRIDGYKNIADYAQEKFELKKTATHNYLGVIERFGNIDDTGAVKELKEEFKEFTCSQLTAMLPLSDAQISGILPEWTVRRIKDLGKEKLTDNDSMEENTGGEVVVVDSDEETSDSGFEEYMTAPEINSGSTRLLECSDYEDIVKSKDVIMNAYESMKKDKNFKGKNVRLVVEIAFD